MKSLIEFLSDIRSLGITLSVTADRLVCNAPKGAITPEIKQELADRKADIIVFLQQTQKAPVTDRPQDVNAELPLSHSQQRLWFFTQLDPKNPVYNVVISLWLNGDLKREALERSLRSILERHESLRTGFYERSGQPFAQIKELVSWSLSDVDLSHLESEDAVVKAMQLGREAARKSFALDEPPLFRATLISVAPRSSLLVLSMHHIVSDGWSLGVLSQELTQLYAAFSDGQPSPLAAPTLQFCDYVRWEQDAGRRAADQQLPYWLDRLSGELPVLELPGDRPRPALQSFNGRRISINIDGPLALRVRELSRATGATVFMVLLATFQTLLSRYTGVEDILVGSSTSNRPRQEFTTQIGFFVNNLVLRGNLSGNPTFVELLQRTRETATSAFAHQSVPFERLVEALHPERALSHNPLVQVMFNFQNLPMPELRFAGLTAEVAEVDPGIARADLNLEVWPHNQGFRCDFEYSTDLFDDATIRQMQGHFLNLLEGAVANPETPVAALPLLSQAQYKQIIEEWNDTGTPPQRYSTIAPWFRAQAEATPNAIAVESGGERLTYSQLDERSERLARILRGSGVCREVVVGLFFTRGLEMVVALLAVLKAGGAYLPLDPNFPSQRIAFILSDAEISVLLTQSSLVPALPQSNALLIVADEAVDEDADSVQEASYDMSENQSGPDDLAYLIYTSGSTGLPKGTQLTQRSLVNLISSILHEPGLTSLDTLVAVTTLSFDIASLDVLGPLLCGAKLVIASRDETLDSFALGVLLDKVEATVLQATPSTWRMLVESGWEGKSDLRMWCGGEALSPDLAESLLARGRELWNIYGPTETTIYSVGHRVQNDENPILIGRPLANTQLYILDVYGQPAPIGVAGELYIAGQGVARGYSKRPDLTQSRFLPDPFSKKTGSRMYRTGDLARYRRDGQIQLLGRTDHQIKLRGYRIELGEIEAVIERHPKVLRAAVALCGEGTSQRLIAYVKREEDSAAELRPWLQERLPDYMVPASFIELSEFPLTPNGKIDRNRLPAPEEIGKHANPAVEGARNQMERSLVHLWSDVLRLNSISVHDNFFDLGGHSLLLMQVHARLRRDIDPDLTVIDLFRYPTVESLARHLEQRQHSPEVTS